MNSGVHLLAADCGGGWLLCFVLSVFWDVEIELHSVKLF